VSINYSAGRIESKGELKRWENTAKREKGKGTGVDELELIDKLGVEEEFN